MVVQLDESVKEGICAAGDLERTLSELSLQMAISSALLSSSTTAAGTTPSSVSTRDVTGYHPSTSSGCDQGTCWSRDDDVVDSDDDIRVSWSDGSGSPRPSAARLYHVVSRCLLNQYL